MCRTHIRPTCEFYSVCCIWCKKKKRKKNIGTVLGKNFPKVNYTSRSCSKPSALFCCPFPLYSSQVPPISPVLSCPLSLLLVPSLATCSLRCLKPRASLVNSALWDLFLPRLSFPLSKISPIFSVTARKTDSVIGLLMDWPAGESVHGAHSQPTGGRLTEWLVEVNDRQLVSCRCLTDLFGALD